MHRSARTSFVTGHSRCLGRGREGRRTLGAVALGAAGGGAVVVCHRRVLRSAGVGAGHDAPASTGSRSSRAWPRHTHTVSSVQKPQSTSRLRSSTSLSEVMGGDGSRLRRSGTICAALSGTGGMLSSGSAPCLCSCGGGRQPEACVGAMDAIRRWQVERSRSRRSHRVSSSCWLCRR